MPVALIDSVRDTERRESQGWFPELSAPLRGGGEVAGMLSLGYGRLPLRLPFSVTHPQDTAPLERRTVLNKHVPEVCSLSQAFRARQPGGKSRVPGVLANLGHLHHHSCPSPINGSGESQTCCIPTTIGSEAGLQGP